VDDPAKRSTRCERSFATALFGENIAFRVSRKAIEKIDHVPGLLSGGMVMLSYKKRECCSAAIERGTARWKIARRAGKSFANNRSQYREVDLSRARCWYAKLTFLILDGRAVAERGRFATGTMWLVARFVFLRALFQIFDPKNLRSKFAAFDPSKSD
jgi:hypothetical protein